MRHKIYLSSYSRCWSHATPFGTLFIDKPMSRVLKGNLTLVQGSRVWALTCSKMWISTTLRHHHNSDFHRRCTRTDAFLLPQEMPQSIPSMETVSREMNEASLAEKLITSGFFQAISISMNERPAINSDYAISTDHEITWPLLVLDMINI